MGKSNFKLKLVADLFVIILLTSCGMNSSKSTKEREEILKEITSYQDKLPYNIPNTSISITNIAVDNDIIVYTCKVSSEDWDAMSLASEVSNTDRNMARVISNVSNDAVEKFIEHGLGLKYIYTSDETGETLLEVEMSAEKMKEIKNKVESGEIQPYTMIELSQMEIAKMDIPSQIEDGVWLTDAYIEGNKIYYIATIENEIDSSDLSVSDLKDMKEGLIEGIKTEGLLMIHKKEIVKENIHIIYVYKDCRGKEFARIDIEPDDL